MIASLGREGGGQKAVPEGKEDGHAPRTEQPASGKGAARGSVHCLRMCFPTRSEYTPWAFNGLRACFCGGLCSHQGVQDTRTASWAFPETGERGRTLGRVKIAPGGATIAMAATQHSTQNVPW